MKKEKSTLSKKIKGYSVLAGSMLAISNVGNAQIVYTDLDPDVVGTGNGASYDLDLNNDGTADINYTIATNGTAVKLLAHPLSNNALAGTVGSFGYSYPSAIALNSPIGTSKSWLDGGSQTMASHGYFQGDYGHWFGAIDKYMGVRIKVGTSQYYGWVRLDVSDDAHSFTFKDYAYESTAETQILAGATGGVGINPLAMNDINVFSADNQIHIQSKENLSGIVTVTNLIGEVIKAINANSTSLSINMADQPAGIYLVAIEQNNARLTQKVMVQ